MKVELSGISLIVPEPLVLNTVMIILQLINLLHSHLVTMLKLTLLTNLEYLINGI